VPVQDLNLWLDSYLDAFAACGRGERDPAELLAYFAPPVLLSTDDSSVLLAEENGILGWAQGQIDGMRAADFDRIEVLDRAVEPLNTTTALVRGAFARHRHDGSEIGRLTATYLIVKRADDARIAALMVHSPRSARSRSVERLL
jgi:hypothetical protein